MFHLSLTNKTQKICILYVRTYVHIKIERDIPIIHKQRRNNNKRFGMQSVYIITYVQQYNTHSHHTVCIFCIQNQQIIWNSCNVHIVPSNRKTKLCTKNSWILRAENPRHRKFIQNGYDYRVEKRVCSTEQKKFFFNEIRLAMRRS